MIDRRNILTASAVAAAASASPVLAAGSTRAAPATIQKTPVKNADKSGGPHAIRMRNVSEWMIFAGHAALGQSGEIHFPGDAIGQLRWIWGSLKRLLEQEGFSLADVIQLKMTCVAEVPLPDRVKFLDIAHEIFADMPFRPVGSTMSVVNELAYPGMLVEVDIWAAR